MLLQSPQKEVRISGSVFQTDGDPDFIICNIDTYHKILPSGSAVDSLGIEIVMQVPFSNCFLYQKKTYHHNKVSDVDKY